MGVKRVLKRSLLSLKQLNEVRIIGGKWRRRIIRFPKNTLIRPTLNRIRETLFDWLVSFVEDAICLDLFAGSGALGFEALSRGAKHVVMVDKSRKILEALKFNAENLGARDQITLLQKTVTAKTKLNFYQTNSPIFEKSKIQFDIVFIDPPFDTDLANVCCDWLEKNDYLATQSLIYIEIARHQEKNLCVPQRWKLHRSKAEGQVSYFLFQA